MRRRLWGAGSRQASDAGDDERVLRIRTGMPPSRTTFGLPGGTVPLISEASAVRKRPGPGPGTPSQGPGSADGRAGGGKHRRAGDGRSGSCRHGIRTPGAPARMHRYSRKGFMHKRTTTRGLVFGW